MDLEIPFSSLLSKLKKLNITIIEPSILFSEDLLKKKNSGISTNLPFSINKVNIKRGNIEFNWKKTKIFLVDFDLFSFNRGEELAFKLSSPHLRLIFPVGKREVSLEGELNSEFVKSDKRLKLNKLLWKTKKLVFNVNGGIITGGFSSFRVFWEGNPEIIVYPILKKLSPSGFMSGTVNYIKDEKKSVFISGNFSGNSFLSGGEEFKGIFGKVKWNSRTRKIRSDIKIGENRLLSEINLDSKNGKTNINIKNIPTEKILKSIHIYSTIPAGGIVESGKINIYKSNLNAEIVIKKDIPSEDRFDISGRINIEYNTKSKKVKFSSNGIDTEFGKITSISGLSVPSEKRLEITLNSKVKDLEGINPYTKKYAGLNLEDWSLQKGSGRISVKYRRKSAVSNLKTSINISDFFSNKVLIKNMSGEINGYNSLIKGIFVLSGKNVNGKMVLTKDAKKVDISLENIKGESSDILKIIDVGLDVKGEMRGDFRYINKVKSKYPVIIGSFSGEKILFYSFPFENIAGDLNVSDDVKIKNLKFIYHKGRGSADFQINLAREIYKLRGLISGLELSDFPGGFKGSGEIKFSGEGGFNINPIKVDYNFNNVKYYEDRSSGIKGSADINTDFSSFTLSTKGNIFNGSSISPFLLNLKFIDDRYSGDYNVKIKDINIVLPWQNNSGVLNINGEIKSDPMNIVHFRGYADIKGDYLSFPGFPHTLDDFTGSILFNDSDFTLRSVKGSIGGGNVIGNGVLGFHAGTVDKFLLSISGKNMEIYPMDRTGFKLNADLTLKKSGEKYVLGGDIVFLSALWEREVDEGVSFYSGSNLSPSNSEFLDNLDFNLRMSGKGDIKVRNSFFTGNCNVDLKLTGDKNFPVLFGNIESKDGVVHISSRDFDLIRAKIVFNNPIIINPSINIEAETFVKNYRIRFLLSGLSSDLRPEFFSSPPMPTQDIIALMSLGELFKRPSSTNISSEVGTTGLITSALTEKIQNRVKKLFGIDILKLDPDPTRSSLEGTSRLTIGKSITKDFLIVYSTDISRATRDVYFFQYRVTPSISLIGKRNEDGRLSLDVRFRKRY